MSAYLSAASDAAFVASQFLIRNREKAWQLPTTAFMSDFISDTDTKADELIREHLQARFPHIPYGSEEIGHVEDSNQLAWVVDPINGSFNYCLQDGRWGISIALRKGKRIIAAALTFPMLDDYFTLEETTSEASGYRVLRNNILFDVVPRTYPPQETRFHVGWTKRGHMEVARDLEVTRRLYEASSYPVNTMCGTYDVRSVLIGQAHGAAFRRPGLKDLAGAAAIAKAAGCNVTQFDGSPWELGSSMLCTRVAQYQHAEYVAALKGA